MRLMVLGAGGKTGSLVVEQALAKGHAVTVLVREASEVKQQGSVRVLTGDATIPGDVLKAVEGNDAVIDTIGGTAPYKETTLERTVAHNVVEAMQATGAKRLVVISVMGIGESSEQAPFWYEHLLLPTFLHGTRKDKAAMEQEVRGSGLEFVIARPPLLKDEPAKGNTKVLGTGDTGHEITRADLAQFLVDQLESDAYLGRAVTVVNS